VPSSRKKLTLSPVVWKSKLLGPTEQRKACREIVSLKAKLKDDPNNKKLKVKYRQIMSYVIEANLGMVGMIVKRYAKYAKFLDYNDLMQIGVQGLTKALEKFDPERGYTLWTYANHWVRVEIRRALDEQERTVRAPPYIAETKRRMARVDAIFFTDLGRAPTAEEYAKELDITVSKARSALKANTAPSLSLDYKSVNGLSIMDVLPFDGELQDETIIRERREDWLQKFLGDLPARDREILYQRFWEEKSLNEIGLMFGLTRERIRQIEGSAIARLRQRFTLRKLA
jgi:RNA polymerase primary sigma factor